ncbi:HDIG domain-containing metalloprotein [Micromonospora sp. NPDC049240]|uniref:HDIG domain-containing metalloprotein n=1 Tax=Micromonospora sp. NPDC049240 TaxID=3155151 RepID=UPI0033C7CEC6
MAGSLCDAERRVLVEAAWLHDVGYAQEVRVSGLHALDGARWLRRMGFDERVAGACCLSFLCAL